LNGDNKLYISISYGDSRAEFSGDPETVLISVNKFIAKQAPALDLANKITVNYSVADLIQMFGTYIKITEEGPRVWVSHQKLSDKDTVCLQLVAAKISYLTNKSVSPSLTLQEIHNATSLKPKSISSRLSEMSKAGYVEREQSDQGVRYKITTQGTHWLSGVLEKKMRGAV
jgi:DNA-binding transcriptional ArsR family regulator